MTKAVGRLVGQLLGLAMLVVAAWAGWRWGDAVFPRLEAWVGVDEAPALEVEDAEISEEVAVRTRQRVEAFLAGDSEELALTGPEVTSLLRYGPEVAPSGLHEPAVWFNEGQAQASARVALSDFPALPDLGPAAGMLPDTVSLEIEGSVMGYGEGEAAVVTTAASVAGVPLPRRLIPEVLGAMGRVDRPGLPREAIAVALPPGVASAHVSGDRLILLAQR